MVTNPLNEETVILRVRYRPPGPPWLPDWARRVIQWVSKGIWAYTSQWFMRHYVLVPVKTLVELEGRIHKLERDNQRDFETIAHLSGDLVDVRQTVYASLKPKLVEFFRFDQRLQGIERELEHRQNPHWNALVERVAEELNRADAEADARAGQARPR